VLKATTAKLSALATIAVVLGGSYIAASASTGHPTTYENAAKSSEVTRTISITPSGGTGSSFTNLTFTGLLPGSPQHVSLNYQNTGSSSEDVYVVFPNATSLSALNSLGAFGQVHLTSIGTGSQGNVFASDNLNDNTAHCGHFSSLGCWPLRSQYLIARNVTPSTKGSFTFNFGYSTTYSAQAPVGKIAYWNAYPVQGQTTVVASDGVGAGLPYELVATQPGVTPGQPATISQVDPFGVHLHVHATGHFQDQLEVTGASGAVSFVVTVTNSRLHVSTNGVVSAVGGPLAVGTYVVSGTDSDPSGDVGTWGYTLVVTASRISCRDTDDGNVRSSSSSHFGDRMRDCDSIAATHYITTSGDDHLRVSDNGMITEVGGILSPGHYTVSGTERDSYGDTGTWSYTLNVSR
jgi:hypothetical protein